MTAKKKTLIELMLDSGVKPESLSDETKFIVCDSNSDGMYFISEYKSRPMFKESTREWYSSGFVAFNLDVEYECEKWESTIITKQQFVDAYNEKNKLAGKLDEMDLIAGFRERAMNENVTNIAEDKQIEDVEPCMVVDNSAYDCTTTDDSGISLSFEEADKRADNYASLSNVLRRAYDQASSGKGQERHGQDLPFTKQPMQLIQDLCGEGFALGQAMKKMQESQRLPHDAAIRELLGAINYIAGAIIHKEKLQGSK